MLHGGDPGRRLIEPGGTEKVQYSEEIPSPFQSQPGQWLIVSIHHIYGSEELSALAPGVAELAPQPYLGLRPQDAEILGVGEDQEVQLTVGTNVCRLPVKLRPALPAGVAGLPSGLTGQPMIPLPAWGRVTRCEDDRTKGPR
jgi:NADH-quinone oxidoreductase subunit G